MTDVWIAHTSRSGRTDLARALRSIEPFAVLGFAESAADLRLSLLDEEPGTVGAIVGLSEAGVSDLNLAAAVARDGRASRVVLVVRGASGSLRSRAARANVSEVIDLDELDAQDAPPADAQAGPAATSVGEARGCRVDHASRVEPAPASAEATPAEDEPPLDEPDPSTSRAPILAFASSRGGVGKTALVATAAAVAAKWGLRVAVCDLDLSCGNLFTCYGVRPVDLARLASDELPREEAMGRGCARCADGLFLWGPCERPEMSEVAMPHVGQLLTYLSERFDLVVADTSTTFTDAVAEVVQRCDRLLLVHDDASGSVASLARTSALAVRLGVARTRIMRVQNFMDPRQRMDLSRGRAEEGLEGARAFAVADGGAEVSEMLATGHVVDLVAGDVPYVSGVETMLAQTLSELGRLPDSPAARRALEPHAHRPVFSLFSKRKAAL